jgi:esterase/lipase superfamily enzyme
LDSRNIAHNIVKRALDLVTPEWNQKYLPQWEELRLGVFLPSSSHLDIFWELVVEGVRAHLQPVNELGPFVQPTDLRSMTGDKLVDTVGDWMDRQLPPSPEPEAWPAMAEPEDWAAEAMAEPRAWPAAEAAAEVEKGLVEAEADAEEAQSAELLARAEESADFFEMRQLESMKLAELLLEELETEQESIAPPAAAPKIAPPARLPDFNASLVRIFYCTDRRQASTVPLRYDEGRSAGGQLQYGQCEISIPKTHKTGHLESPSILRFEFRPDPAKHIILTKTETLEEQAFFEQVRSSVARSKTNDAFVFVHGYNVSFEDAARRTGQIAFDLQFVGAPIFYSWPSNGHTKDYLKDETNITWTAPHFQRFLTLLAQLSGAARIHVIAHSMGNRAVCEALRNLSFDKVSPMKLNHLVLAAPDIDADTFRELAAMLQACSLRVTLYESSKDKAIWASRKIHGNPRAGEPLLIVPGIDTIDASAIDTDFLAHSYFSDNWPLLADIHSILSKDEAPATRFGLIERDHETGRYYAFRA